MTGRIELPDESPELVRHMVQYCYLMDYPDTDWDLRCNQEFNVRHVSRTYANAQMYSLADKYGIGGLKELAAENFEVNLAQEFSLGDETVFPEEDEELDRYCFRSL